MKQLLQIACGLLALTSCQKKYTITFLTEQISIIPSKKGLLENETIKAKNDESAYRKAVKLLMKKEKENSSKNFVYTTPLLYDKSGKSVQLSLLIMSSIDYQEGMSDYINERKRQKRGTGRSYFIEKQIKEDNEKYNIEKYKINK